MPLPSVSTKSATPTDASFADTTLEPAATLGFLLLTNPAVGYRLTYPDNWKMRGQAVATEFAVGADCRSVEIVDYQPPEGSSVFILHSLVQICARPLDDALSLEQFMRQTYSSMLEAQLAPVEFSGHPAYRSRKGGPDTTIFVQTEGYRIQIVSVAAAAPDLFPVRAGQVQEILEGFRFEG